MSNTATMPAPLLDREQIQEQIKPLSNNGFKALLQRIGRWWLKGWYGFSDKRPGLSKLIYKVFMFLVFSLMVTVLQMVLFMFLPSLFSLITINGVSLSYNDWMFPNVYMGTALVDIPVYAHLYDAYGAVITNLFGQPQLVRVGYIQREVGQYFSLLGVAPRHIYLSGAGGITTDAAADGGLAYFISISLAIFIAQVVNFPLQRNITFKSKGNPAYQAMWYLIGWILIQPLVFGIGNAWKGAVALFLNAAWHPFLVMILDLIVTGGVSMIIFFFIFKIIFPDRNAIAKKAKARLEAAQAKGVTGDHLAKLEAKHRDTEMRARFANADKEAAKLRQQASAKAIAFFAAEDAYEKATKDLEAAQAGNITGAQLANAQLTYAEAKARVPAKLQLVSEAAYDKEKALAELEETTAAFNSYKQELGLAK